MPKSSAIVSCGLSFRFLLDWVDLLPVFELASRQWSAKL
jgi:hypothetical protein